MERLTASSRRDRQVSQPLRPTPFFTFLGVIEGVNVISPPSKALQPEKIHWMVSWYPGPPPPIWLVAHYTLKTLVGLLHHVTGILQQ
jgi:hypothetical protein